MRYSYGNQFMMEVVSNAAVMSVISCEFFLAGNAHECALQVGLVLIAFRDLKVPYPVQVHDQ